MCQAKKASAACKHSSVGDEHVGLRAGGPLAFYWPKSPSIWKRNPPGYEPAKDGAHLWVVRRASERTSPFGGRRQRMPPTPRGLRRSAPETISALKTQ